jgi:hypothetical protein
MDDSQVTIHTSDGLHKLLLGKKYRTVPNRPHRGPHSNIVLDGVDIMKHPFPEDISSVTFKLPPVTKRPESDADHSLHRVPMVNYNRLRNQ